MYKKNSSIVPSRNRKLAAALTVSLAALSLAAAPLYASDETTANSKDTAEAAVSSSSSVEKEETVYVISDAAGSVKEVLVSDWLKNKSGEDVLADKTFLKDIENLKGEETWSEQGDGEIKWNADGNDIYYQGSSDKELPVDVTVRYYLDGEEMLPDEIAGKSGEVTVRYEYSNNEMRDVTLDDEDVTLHVPFAVVTGMVISTDCLSDVETVNGRIFTDGERTIALGIAFPGIAEDLQSPAYLALTGLTKAEVPDFFEITGHAENFEWGTSYTFITNEVFSEDNDGIENSLEGIIGKLGALHSGVGKIAKGVSGLSDGAGELADGAKALSEGLNELEGNNEALQDGAGQIFDGILANVKEQINTAGLSVGELTRDNYKDVLSPLAEAAEGENKEQLTSAIRQLDSVNEFCNGLTAYLGGVSEAKDGAEQLREGISTLQGGVGKLVIVTGLLKASVPDFSGVTEALKESAALGKAYNNYSGLAEGTKGKVRFIWKSRGIE